MEGCAFLLLTSSQELTLGTFSLGPFLPLLLFFILISKLILKYTVKLVFLWGKYLCVYKCEFECVWLGEV